jgi:hypothetical protein
MGFVSSILDLRALVPVVMIPMPVVWVLLVLVLELRPFGACGEDSGSFG